MVLQTGLVWFMGLDLRLEVEERRGEGGSHCCLLILMDGEVDSAGPVWLASPPAAAHSK